MANYTNLKSIIARVIRENGNQEITGPVLQAVLIDMVTSLGNGFIYKGVVTPNSTITPSDQNIFYIGGAGFYPNFVTPFTVDSGYIGLFKYNGSWTLETVFVGSPPDAEVVRVSPQSFTAEQQAQARENIGAGTYSKPATGIPASDLASGVIPDVSVKQHRYEVSDLSSITDPKEGDVAVVTEYEPLGFIPSLSGTESLCARAKQMPTNPGTWSVYSLTGSYDSVILQSFQGDSSAGKINVLDENGVVVGVLPDYDSDDYYEFLRGPSYGLGFTEYYGTTYQTGQYVQLYRATRHAKEYLYGEWVDVNDRGLLMTSDSIPSPWSTGKTLAETAAIFGITEAQLLSLCDGAYSTIVTFDVISGSTDLVTVTSTAVGVVVLSFATLGLAKRYNLTYDVTFDIGSGSSYSNFTLTDTTPVTDVIVGGTSVVNGSRVAVVPAIPDAVEANPTVPSGTTPTSLTGLKIGSGYYSISGGGGGGPAITSQEIADIWTSVMS